MIKEASTKECRTLPCSVVLAELLPCDPVDLLSWNPLLVADASPAGFTRPEEEVDPMEFRRSTRFRRTSRRRWHCISRRRHRSSSVSVGSELVRSSGSGAASDGSASRSPSKEETEQTEAMEEERGNRGRLASVPKRPPRDRPRLSSMSSDSPPAASSRGAPAPPNAPRKSLDAITKLRTHGTHYREQQKKAPAQSRSHQTHTIGRRTARPTQPGFAATNQTPNPHAGRTFQESKNGSTPRKDDQRKNSEATTVGSKRNDRWTSRIGRGYRGKREEEGRRRRRQARQSDW
jgi:hypothetical protein